MVKEDLTTTVVKAPTLNITNFTNLVKDGTIFGVEFVKRTTGERRKMQYSRSLSFPSRLIRYRDLYNRPLICGWRGEHRTKC